MERQRGVTLRFLAEPGDVNFGGKVNGGAVMKWMDQGGYSCAAGWSAHYCVTVYVGDVRFTFVAERDTIGGMWPVRLGVAYRF